MNKTYKITVIDNYTANQFIWAHSLNLAHAKIEKSEALFFYSDSAKVVIEEELTLIEA